jgi:general secretion pathway protein D
LIDDPRTIRGKEHLMKTRIGCVAVCASIALLATSAGFAQTAPSRDGAVPLTSLISEIANRTGKRFVVDPRAKVDVTLIQRKPEPLDYAEVLTVLQVHGFTAVEEGNLVRVVPDANVRNLAVPLVSDKDKRADAEYITKVIAVRTTSAAMLVPMLRPLMPMQAHLAASVCTNGLVIVDTVANVRRIEAIVRSLDDGEKPFPQRDCAAPQSTSEPKKEM